MPGATRPMDKQLEFVTDTHALWWYLRSPSRLSSAATAVFRLAETGNALINVPAIVVAELDYLSMKLDSPVRPRDLMTAMGQVNGIRLEVLDAEQLAALDRFADVPDMRGRLIAACAFARGAAVVTRDQVRAASGRIETVW